MATTEHTINDALAGILKKTRRAWQDSNVVRSENTGMLKGSHAQPDILLIEPNVSPVVIETEVLPANTVESDAISRLGEQVRVTGRTILSSVAVRLPVRLRTKQGTLLRSELVSANDIEMALYTGSDPSGYSRWPRSGWIPGGISDLSILAQSASVPPDIIDEAANQLVSGVSEAAGLLAEMAKVHPGAIHKISEELCQEASDQTRRMAATMLANAFVFQETLAGGAGELASVNSLEQLRGASGGLMKSTIVAEWRKILKADYWPIFDIARRILEVIPTAESKPLIEGLAVTADKLLQNRLMRSHDLTGAVFQRLIADRKFLAAYYTTPASAALLVGLAITSEATPAGGSWSSADDVKNLRLADFACGTGTLLSTAYKRVSQLHELAGGDIEALHPQMMASALVGCDVLPAAAHLTASMLSGAHPTVKYEQSSILTVAYGKQPDGAIALGSLDLLDPQGKFEILSITAKAAESMSEAEKETWRSLPHASFDAVVMNPPFTRATGHEGRKIGIPNPMFAAFSSSAEEQRLMSKATRRLTEGTSAHGNAGEASIFLVLADRKLKADGMLALVMPLSLMAGPAWENSRGLLAKNYSNLVLISIAGADGVDLSFSADTDMGECLVIGRKSKTGSTRATFVILNERPAYPLLGASAAEQIRRLIVEKNLRCLEDGPVGGTLLHFGDEVIGQVLDAPLPASGSWNLSRTADLSLAQAAYQLANEKRVWLPTMNKSEVADIPITTVAEIGEIGPYHADINGNTSTGGIRGPFDISPVKPNSAPTYPVLWSHDAKRERTMSFEADCEGIPRRGSTQKEQATVDLKVASVWNTASHSHFNRDFRFNSQSTGMQFTSRRTIGGRAWLSIRLSSVEQEKALVLWANTSLGLLLHWWHANKQQSGRGSVGKLALQTLPVLDVTALKPKQIAEALELFDTMSGQQLLPMHEIDRDPIRKELDEKFARNVLGLTEPILTPGGPLEVLRMKLSREPSVRGQK
jgi:surface antigen